MIYSIWLCYSMINLKSYSQGISILLLILNILDIVKGSSSLDVYDSQGNKHAILKKRSVQLGVCNLKNLENLLNYTSIKHKSPSQLSSNYKPSDRNSSSSTNTILLPQGNGFVKQYLTLAPVFSPTLQRINVNEKVYFPPIAGCIDLQNYNPTFRQETERHFSVQIFLFHFSNDSEISINVDLKLYSTQEPARNRAVVIVLSSFLPRKFYLSAISLLSYSQHSLHILMTHSKSEVIIRDDPLTVTHMKKTLFISTILNLSIEGISNYDGQNNDEYINTIREQFMKSSFLRKGHFFGMDFLSIKKVNRKMWLFHKIAYSQYPPDMRIVAIYLVNKHASEIELILGKPINSSVFDKDFRANNCRNVKALSKVLKASTSHYDVDKSLTCSYNVKSSLSDTTRFKTITWLHLSSVSNISLDIEFQTTKNLNENKYDTYLLILTGNEIEDSVIRFYSLFGRKVYILTNISRNQFGPLDVPESYNINLHQISDLNSGSFQDQTIANYISAGSSTVMQTTIYRFLSNSNKAYRVEINIDDSRFIPDKTVIIDSSCWIYSTSNIIFSMSIDLEKWKLIHQWIPSKLILGNDECVFKNIDGNVLKITKQATQCSSRFVNDQYSNKIYGVWNGKKYPLNLEIKQYCEKSKVQNIDKKPSQVTTTAVKSYSFIPISINGFFITNISNFTSSSAKSYKDKSRIFFQITSDIEGNRLSLDETIQLRNCYVTNRKASETDFQSTTKGKAFRKVTIIHEGCFNKSSHWYSNIPDSSRPVLYHKYDQGSLPFKMYRFSIVVDAEKWAHELYLGQKWVYEGQYQVHLYCSINKCFNNKTSKPTCKSELSQCKAYKESTDYKMKYYGLIVIARHDENVALKLSVLSTLVALLILLLICLTILFWRFRFFRPRHRRLQLTNKMLEHGPIMGPEIVLSSPRKRSVNLDYHSLTLTNSGKKSTVKLYSDSKFQPTSSASLKRLIENCDKSIFLNAGYLSSPPITDQSQVMAAAKQSMSAKKRSRFKSHSLSDINQTEPIPSNWLISSWPLSTAERKRKSQGQNNDYKYNCRSSKLSKYKSSQPNSSWHQNNSGSGFSSKQKISYTFNSDLKSFSNLKASSNRTTVSESMSANELPSKSGSKWWSVLTNYWMNQNVGLSRN